MDEHDVQKAINFDLDTKALKEYYFQMTGNNYTQAYSDIRAFMAQNSFVHRQGSGYISSNLLIKTQVTRLAMKMQKQLPWILLCAKKIDVTDIKEQYDLLKEMKECSDLEVNSHIEEENQSKSNNELYNIRKAINFDLDTKALREYYCPITGNDYTQAYSNIRNFMTQNGFIHRQGSGYISSDSLLKTQITQLAIKMQKQLPWILSCAKKIDVTDLGKHYDLISEIEMDAKRTREQIMEQYPVGKYFDGSTIIDTETLMHDHPEVNLYDEPQDLWMQENIQKEQNIEMNDKYNEWDYER